MISNNILERKQMPLSELRPDKIQMQKVENVAVAPNQEWTLADLNGPGQVSSIWMALGGGNFPTLDGRLRVYYDGSANPSIDIDMGTLLVTHWGAGTAYGSHNAGHMHMEINSNNHDTGFLLTFPMPFGSHIRIAYYNVDAGQTAYMYSMVTYSLTDPGVAYRLRCQGARWRDQAIWRNAGDTTTLLDTGSGMGWIVYHSQVGGLDANNFSWLERNFAIYLDGESNPSLLATGTEDWYDSAWYFNFWRDYPTSRHTCVGTMAPSNAPNAAGMATDFMSKWGGIKFNSKAHMQANPEPACNTGDHFCYCVLYYQ